MPPHVDKSRRIFIVRQRIVAKYFRNAAVRYIRGRSPIDFTSVLTDSPHSSTTVEVRACRDVWAVMDRPGLQSLFTNQEGAINHARQILAGQPGLIEVRDEDAVLLTTLDLREVAPDEMACA